MSIPALPALDRTSATFKTDLDTFFLYNLPATTAAFNGEIERISALGYGSYSSVSVSSITISTGAKTLQIEIGKSFTPGQPIIIASVADVNNFMQGQVSSYDPLTGVLVCICVSTNGAGTFADWSVSLTAIQAPLPLVFGRVGDLISTARLLSEPEFLTADGSLRLKSSYPELSAVVPFTFEPGSWAAAANLPASATWCGLVYGGGLYVVFVYDTSTFYTSSDLITWTARSTTRARWGGAAYASGTFVVVSQSASAYTSTDGITWTARAMPSSRNWRKVRHVNGQFMSLGGDSGTACATSPDGITWTARTLPTSADWFDVAYGNGVYVAISSGTACATSPDGITWTARTLPTFGYYRAVVFGLGLFVAASASGIQTSTDGITWTQGTAGSSITEVTFLAGVFVATGTGPSYTSSDGITWASKSVSPASTIAVCTSNGAQILGLQTSSNVAVTLSNAYDQSTLFRVPTINQPIPFKTYIKATS